MIATETPRIYVASLSDYNAGILHGTWIDITEDTTADDIQESINAMLAESTEEIAEEWAIHDYDGFPNMGEYADLDTVARIGRGIAKHGDAFVAWVENAPSYNTDPDDFEQQYQGEYEDEADYGYQWAEEIGLTDKLEEAGMATGYINWDRYGTDLLMDGWYTKAPNGNIYVFRG